MPSSGRCWRAASPSRAGSCRSCEPRHRPVGSRTGEATDAGLPEEGTDGHATLLLAERVAADPDRWHPLAELDEHVAELARRHAAHWRKAAQTPDGARDLCRRALTRLEGLRFVQRSHDAARARPALFRYAAEEPTVAAPRQARLLGG